MTAADEAPASPDSQFATAFRGYDQRQVDERLQRLTEELKEASSSRDKALASVADLTKALGKTQEELEQTKSGLARMANNPSGPAAMTERVQMMMRLADEEIAELRSKAEDEMSAARADADSYAQNTRDKARADAERLAEDARNRREELDAEAKRQREEADREAEEERAAKQAETERLATEREESARARADEMIADAERKLAEATATRQQALDLERAVHERLTGTNTAVQDALAALARPGDKAPEEPAGSETEPAPKAETNAKAETKPTRKPPKPKQPA